MSKQATCRSPRVLGQIAAVALLAGAAAGCSSDVTRFDGMFGGSDARSSQIEPPASVGGSSPDMMATGSIQPQSPQVQRPTTVTNNLLPPPPGAVASNAPFVRQGAAGPAPSSNWTPNSGTSITVRDGDTVAVLARRYGVSEQAITSANNVPAGVRLTPGQTIVIPAGQSAAAGLPATATVASAAPAAASNAPGEPPRYLGQLPLAKPHMAVAAATPAAPIATTGASYTVKSGDSLGRIAAAHGLRSADLARANGLEADQAVRAGQVLRLPAPTVPAGPQVASAAPSTLSDALPAATPAPAQPAPMQVAAAVPASTAAAAAAPQTRVASVATTQSAADGAFRWPVRGRVISGFGVKPDGDRNDGINIEVPEGTPIKAAEGGEVIYAGNELKGFGNLVLVKHSNGFVSAYAHASEVLVRRGDQISRGQTIAKVGATGNVTRPQLHFELREGNKPVDPLPYLSG